MAAVRLMSRGLVAGSRATRRVHPERLHAVAAAFLAHEAFDEARDGRAGLFAMGRQVGLADGPAMAATQALDADASDRSLFRLANAAILTPYATLTCDLPEIGRPRRFGESALSSPGQATGTNDPTPG